MSLTLLQNRLGEFTSRMFLRMIGSALGQWTELDNTSGFIALVSLVLLSYSKYNVCKKTHNFGLYFSIILFTQHQKVLAGSS